MNDVLLTSEGFIRNASNIDDNISSKFLLSAIRESQEITLQGILGSNLYNRLKELVSTGDIKNAEFATYKKVLDIAQYTLLYDVLSKVCIITSTKINNAGVYQSNDVNMASIQIKDVFAVSDYYINKKDFYIKRLQDCLLDNCNDLKELTKCDCYSMHNNLYSAASCNVNLGGKRGKKSNSAEALRWRLGYDY